MAVALRHWRCYRRSFLGARGAGDGIMLHVPGRGVAILSTLVGHRLSGNGIRRLAPCFRNDHRQEVWWLKMAAKNNTARKESPVEKPAVARVRAVAGGDTLPDLDRLIHERMRLGIVSALAANQSLTFNELKKLLKTTDGNLSVHARKLEEANYIACAKSFQGRMPKTEYRLTDSGRKALEKYLNHMEALIHAMREL